MCSTFSKFLFINLLYCNILLSQQKKKEIGFVKEYLVILESLGKLLKKKKDTWFGNGQRTISWVQIE